jgi:alpha,alpha-trehalase
MPALRRGYRFLTVAALIASVTLSAANLDIRAYIAATWNTLTRSNRDLAKAAVDPKFPAPADGRWPVFVSARTNALAVEAALRREMQPGTFDKIAVRNLPADPGRTVDPGLLYLPKPYVVPGGRFNEMYGWDSYFILLGLVADRRLDLARAINDNFLYEIREYGRILNANRTYYLSRSQPPFLTRMLLEVYAADHDKSALERAFPEVLACYKLWATEPHLTPETGLARYWDFGEGPAPEVISAEKDAQGRTHYELVRDYFRTHKITDYDVAEYYDARTGRSTPAFYKGDRSMRESGFDPSNRFGPFNIDIVHYNPVCLNSLLYRMETDIAEILDTIGRGGESGAWRIKASDRAARVNRLMWDAQDELFYDYDFVRKRIRRYPFLTTFYPLWAGLASKAQAAGVVRNLKKFERPGGLETSTFESGNQWDAPFGWAPLQFLAVEGLRRYGFGEDADRISREFVSMVDEEFRKTGIIVEKYDVVRRGAEVSAAIRFGYHTNEPGFGWTNGVVLRFMGARAKAARGAN